MDAIEAGRKVVSEMLPGGRSKVVPGSFGSELSALSLENVFGRLWAREGLDRRSRSLVTLGILIALRAEDEIAIHMQIGLTNGLTREELEEVVLHASGYVGFPSANAARRAGASVLDEA
jgi:4-carboxymuconolactone decarboxylase